FIALSVPYRSYRVKASPIYCIIYSILVCVVMVSFALLVPLNAFILCVACLFAVLPFFIVFQVVHFMHILCFPILIPFFAAALIPLLYRRIGKLNVGWFVLIVPLVLFIIFALRIPDISAGDTIASTLEWIPSLGINFSIYLDGLSLILALLITGMGSLVILYSIYYLSPYDSLPHFYAYLLLFMGAMLGVVLSDNLLVLYVFWELTSISSFLLIAFWYHRKNSRAGAQKSMLITVFGGFAMLAGFFMLHS